MSGGCVCRKHNVKFYNQNYCDYCKQEQIKMTRDEAQKIFENCKYSLIDTFEALGLLKFDEAEMEIWRRNDNVDCAFPKGHDPNTARNCFNWTKVVKPQIHWRNNYGNECYFSDGFDPNTNAANVVWTKVTKPQSEFLTIHVGNHTHDVALETIVNALKAKGYVVYSPGKLS